MKEIGIYIHIPFCMQKCLYCDFISYANQQDKMEAYIEALKKEIEEVVKETDKEEVMVSTIYIGGGTPSYIGSKQIVEVVRRIKENFVIMPEAEITIEINPGTVTKEKLQDYKKVGINRISIGLQATQNHLLQKIGRIHTYEQFLDTYEQIKEVGFKNKNIDLMIGLPDQTIEDVKESIRKVSTLDPTHISVYSLIIEEGTPIEKKIKKGEYILPAEELERQMYWTVKAMLEEQGYEQYEISNFAKKGYFSKHNWNCWKQKEYFGFGVAAHSYWNGKRYSNLESIEEYIENIKNGKKQKNVILQEIQTKEEMQKEYMLLGLRTLEGISIKRFKEKFGCNPIFLYHKELERLVEENLIEIDLDQIRLTKKGLDFANLVWEEFV